MSTDAVARARVGGYKTAERIVMKAAVMDADFEMTMCATGKPLWKRNTGQVRLVGGFIIARVKGWDTGELARYAMTNLPPRPKRSKTTS